VNVLPRTNITVATAYNESNAATDRFVVFQDPTNALIVCKWEPTGKNWTTTNYSENWDESTPLNVASRTPLASEAVYSVSDSQWSLYVWYLHPNGKIKSLSWRWKYSSSNLQYPVTSMPDLRLSERAQLSDWTSRLLACSVTEDSRISTWKYDVRVCLSNVSEGGRRGSTVGNQHLLPNHQQNLFAPRTLHQ
jgi:hypothetical protein